MSPIGIPAPNPVNSVSAARSPAKVRDAAEQFEALLIGQILHSARDSESSASADSITDFAEQQLAAVLSRSGGLGIGAQIARGLAAGEITGAGTPTRP